MNFYKIGIQLLIFCLLFFFLFRFLCMEKRKKRIMLFTLREREERKAPKVLGVDFISKILEKMVIFNQMASYYNKYIYEDSILRKGMDFISLKVIGGFFVTLLYFLQSLIGGNFAFEKGCFSFLIGVLFTDVCIFIYNKKKTRIEFSSLLNSIFVMYNSIKVGKSIETSLKDSIKQGKGNTKKELKKVLEDLEIGLSLSESFYHMYERTSILFIKEISIILRLLNRNDINAMKVFDILLKKALKEQKNREELIKLRNRNYISALCFALLPVGLLFFLMVESSSFVILMKSKYIHLWMGIESLLYIFYIVLLYKLVRSRRG